MGGGRRTGAARGCARRGGGARLHEHAARREPLPNGRPLAIKPTGQRAAGSKKPRKTEARKEVSHLPGCVALRAWCGQPLNAGFTVVGCAAPPGTGHDQTYPGGCRTSR